MDFHIFEPPKDKDRHENLLPKICKKRFRMNLVGESGSGKSQFIFNVIFKWCKEYIKKSKAKVVVMTGTKDTAVHFAKLAKSNRMKQDEFKIYDYFDVDELKKIYVDHDSKHPLFIVLDDTAFLDGFSSPHKKNILSEIYASGRHKNVSIITSLQKYFYLAEDCRSINATTLVIYGLSKKELERLYEENMSTLMSEREFYKIVSDNLREQYNFIVFDKPSKKLYNSKFEEIPFDKLKF